MQKELGRYLFSVFLEKRKIDRHLIKKIPTLGFKMKVLKFLGIQPTNDLVVFFSKTKPDFQE